VLAQFAEDGGNREQALNYQLFAFELCWQARMALQAAGQKLGSAVEARLRRAARFFWEVQVEREPWDYGDSDSAQVLPCFAREQTAVREWRAWFARTKRSVVLDYWLGAPPELPGLKQGKPAHAVEAEEWWVYPESGIGICESGYLVFAVGFVAVGVFADGSARAFGRVASVDLASGRGAGD
jgi:hypothetical protein